MTSLSVPRGTLAHLPAWLRVEDVTDWDFRSATAPPARQPGEERAGWLDDTAADEIRELLGVANPEASTWPGGAQVRRWAGIRAGDGRLDVCLADTSTATSTAATSTAATSTAAHGVGHFSAISTRPDARGQGLGAAITAWATRRLFEEGYDVVTLGVYADNAAARHIYDRLGFTDHHHFTSAVCIGAQRPSV